MGWTECRELNSSRLHGCPKKPTHKVKRSEGLTFAEGVTDLIDSRDGKFGKYADVLKSFIVHSSANTTAFLRAGHGWKGPGAAGVLNEVSRKKRDREGGNLGGYGRVGRMKAGCDGLSTRTHMNLEGDCRAEPPVVFEGGKAIGVLGKNTRPRVRNSGRPSRSAEIEVNLSRTGGETVSESAKLNSLLIGGPGTMG